ncbi:hypothetical protein GQX74_011780 [Glossina fuscipes]|nr:hypothetical protein GQX74_011780 [Glossina fuscipes]
MVLITNRPFGSYEVFRQLYHLLVIALPSTAELLRSPIAYTGILLKTRPKQRMIVLLWSNMCPLVQNGIVVFCGWGAKLLTASCIYYLLILSFKVSANIIICTYPVLSLSFNNSGQIVPCTELELYLLTITYDDNPNTKGLQDLTKRNYNYVYM